MKILDFPNYMDFDERGELNYQFQGAALGQALDNWLRATPTTMLYGAGGAGLVWRYVHKPLTPEYATRFQGELTRALEQTFDPPLEVRFLEVIADQETKSWKIYGEVYSPYYAIEAEINYTLGQ